MPTRRTPLKYMRSATLDYLPDTRLVQGRACPPREVQRVLPVPGAAPWHRGPGHAHRTETQSLEEVGDSSDHHRVNLRVAHQPATTDQLGTSLKLGFDEQDRLPQRRRGEEKPLQSHGQGDKGEVSDQELRG